MRGTPAVYRKPHILAGIIPAYAGNTTVRVISAQDGRDHPRVCGEHHDLRMVPETVTGSSPRMRGTLARSLRRRGIHHQAAGIIPAYAGNTLRDYSNFVVSKFMSFVFHLV